MSKTKGSVSIHKKGRYILPIAENAYAAEVLREITERNKIDIMCQSRYYGMSTSFHWKKGKVEIYNYLGTPINDIPIVKILKEYGLEVKVSDTLANYMKKEYRRQKLESTPLPIHAVDQEIPLFERCVEGITLLCKTEFKVDGVKKPLFEKGKRYLITGVGAEGTESVKISTVPMGGSAVISDQASSSNYTWSLFDESMDTYFTDSDDGKIDKDITQIYPEFIEQNKKKLMKMPIYPLLYEHVAVDAINSANKRGVMNAYPMRMAKSSFGIAVVEMQESKKVMIGSPNNARLMWIKEFKRMGFTQGKDFIDVNSLKDLENPAKYHLMTFGWMRQSRDPAYKDRRDWNNLLKPSTRTVKTKDSGSVVVKLTNDCPHCSKPMERLVQADILDENGLVVGKDANHRIWTTARGYICRNRKCSWTETIPKGKGAAWQASKARSVNHTGGYVDFELAKHANCDDKRIQGRLCPTCGTADAVWQPGRYKRIARKYTSAIIDEAHAGKDDSSATYTAISSIRTRRRQALTGTPIANSPMDIYWVLHWALRAPNMQFPFSMSAGEKEFDFQYCDQITLEKTVTTTPDKDGKTQTVVKKVRKRIPYLKNPPEFWEFTAPKIIRRSYNDSLFREALRKANKFMPKVEPLKVSVPMTAEQAALTLAALREFKAAYEKKAEEAASKQQQVNMTQVQNMGQMVTMRTLATCPEYVNEKTGTKVYTGTAGGGKLVEISKIVKEKTATGGKVVILSDFRAMQKTLADALKSYGVIRFDTDWDDAERMEAFDKFNTDPKVKVFIAGTRAVRESVDFSCADTCICADLLWSPAFQTQAWSRILAPTDRERKCEIIVMMSKNSIDEHIYNVFYGKLVGSEQALDRKSLNKRAKDVDVKWFVNSILEEASQLENFLKDFKIFNSVSRKIDFAAFEERIM
jgi:superfamily II DNA or RNA helicase